jgi:C_GCAxxG_C_C family probable redox protein
MNMELYILLQSPKEVKVINRAEQRSGELFDSGYYCAESVIISIAECRDIKSDLIPKIATGFCSGISRTCGLCGAVAGGILALNLISGRNAPDESVERNYAVVRKFINMFESRFGSTNCRQLTGCDLGTEEGQKTFHSGNQHERCKDYTEEAAKMAMLIIEEEETVERRASDVDREKD